MPINKSRFSGLQVDACEFDGKFVKYNDFRVEMKRKDS